MLSDAAKLQVALVALAAVVSAQLGGVNLPPCAETCILESQTTCVLGIDDINCLCHDQTYLTQASQCIHNTCTGSDLDNARQSADQLCASVGVTLTSSASSTSTSSTGSSSSSSSSSNSGSGTKTSSGSSPSSSSSSQSASSTNTSTCSGGGSGCGGENPDNAIPNSTSPPGSPSPSASSNAKPRASAGFGSLIGAAVTMLLLS